MINKKLSNLKNINWGEFKIGDIFNIERSKVHDKINLKETHRGIPHISRTNSDNGLNCIVVNENFEQNPKNTIVFGAENANFFFQPFNYITGDKMYVISHEKLNKYNSLFIKLMLEYSIKHSGFGYGKGLTGNRLKRLSILLPLTENGLPNWNLMESYINSREKSLLREYKSYLDEKLLLIQDKEEGYLLSEDEFFTKDIKWDTFILSEIFEIESSSSGIDKNKLINEKGMTPYITRTYKNNGITDFIGKQDENYLKNEGNVISIGSDTQTVFYQVNEFYTGKNIQIVYNNNLNKYNALFIIPLLEKLMEKFNWGGNGATLTRLKKSRIMLPINSEKNPDWDLMESYMKKLEYKKISEYLRYIENRT